MRRKESRFVAKHRQSESAALVSNTTSGNMRCDTINAFGAMLGTLAPLHFRARVARSLTHAALFGVAVPWNVSLPVGAFAIGGLDLAFGKAGRLRINPLDTNKPATAV